MALSLVGGVIADRVDRIRRMMLFGVLLYCVALALLAVTPWFWLALVAAALLGVFNTVQVVPRIGAIMANSPDHI